MFRQKNTSISCVKKDIFQKVRKCPLTLAHVVNTLHTKFKYNIAICKVNVY